MSYSVQTLKDSVSEERVRLRTVVATFPRMILPEVLTHRVFTRNTGSSRAVPVKRVLEQVKNNPAMPIHWGRNRPGMVADGECSESVFLRQYVKEINAFNPYGTRMSTVSKVITRGFSSEEAWLEARDCAVEVAEAFDAAGYHKQVVNRLLEPFVWTPMIISSTYWQNFFNLRIAEDAQPEIRHIATMMEQEHAASIPSLVRFGQWHLPYITPHEEYLSSETLRKCSAARLARVSYNNHDGTAPDLKKDFATFELVLNEGGSLHGSCFEHIATPVPRYRENNFYGWMQWRNILDKNNPYQEFYEGPCYG